MILHTNAEMRLESALLFFFSKRINYTFSFTSIDSSHYFVQCHSYAYTFCSRYAERSVQRFISFDEIGTLCKLRRLRNTRKASERVVVTRTHYSVSVRRAMPTSSLEAWFPLFLCRNDYLVTRSQYF